MRRVLSILCCCLPCAVSAADNPGRYVFTLPGELPIILEAPHDGTMAVPGVPKRTVKSGGRDTHTAEVLLGVRERMLARTGQAPAVVIMRAHRDWVEANRNPGPSAYGHPFTKRIYDVFDAGINTAITNLRSRHGSGLLVSFHCGYSFPLDVYTSVNHVERWSTIPAFVRRHGWAVFHGPDGIAGRLFGKGYVVPGFGGQAAHGGWAGMVIMRHCRHRHRGVDGLQFEFSGNRLFRSPASRAKLAVDVADVLLDFVTKYYAPVK